MVVFEELGGDPSKISLVKRSVTGVCADAFEHHPSVESYYAESRGESKPLHQAEVHLRCSPGQSISTIKFASFGTPSGTCGSFLQGACHAPNSHAVIEKVLLTSTIVPVPFRSECLQMYTDLPTDNFST